MLNKLLNEEFIRLNIECCDWKDAIKMGAALLVDNGCIEETYENAIFDNFKEYGPYMVIAPGIVLSHARPENGVKELSLSLITLKTPVNFGNDLNDPVKLIITLAAKDNESHLKALSQLMELFMNNEDLKFIIEAKNQKQAMGIINKYSM